MPRGGKRMGTPGKGYSNRTDLAVNPNMAVNTAATGGMSAPPTPPVASPPTGQPPVMSGPAVGADEVPNLSDPTQRPNEPIMTGVSMGAGAGSEALGPMPPNPMDPTRMAVQALMQIAPSPDLARILNRLDFEGR